MEDLGSQGEKLVADHYRKLGYKIQERNYIFPKGKRMGELDLVVSREQELVFVEVKTRTNKKFGSAFEAVDFFKQRKLVKMAKLYRQLHPKLADWQFRIDVAAVDVDNPVNPVIILANAIEDLS